MSATATFIDSINHLKVGHYETQCRDLECRTASEFVVDACRALSIVEGRKGFEASLC